MIEWIKRLFGFAEVVLTLEQKHKDALLDAESAIRAFTGAADLLEFAAKALRETAEEASAIAQAHLERAERAVTEADANALRATKIRDLIG